MLPNADETTHVTFSLFPSQINSIRHAARSFGSVGRAVHVAVEVLYALRDKKNGLLGLDETGVPAEVEDAFCENRETYKQKQLELRAPMSCNLLPRTAWLIGELAKPEYYGHRYYVIGAVEYWLLSAISDERTARATKQREEEEKKLDPEVRQSMERLRHEFL